MASSAHTPLRAVYNTKTGRVIVYDEEHDQEGRGTFLVEKISPNLVTNDKIVFENILRYFYLIFFCHLLVGLLC